MKKLLPYYFKYIGLLIVFISIVYELIRTPLNFNKGIFSICVGLMLIIVSKNKVENTGGENIFFPSFLITWFLFIVSNSILETPIEVNLFILIYLLVLNLLNLISYKFKKKSFLIY